MATTYPVSTRPLLTNNSASVTIVICTPVYDIDVDKVAPARANAAATTRVLAFVMADIAGAASGFCQPDGVIVGTVAQWNAVTEEGAGGLTTGSVYYLSAATAGKITLTPPTTGYVVEVGQAISTTELDINIKQPIKLSTAAAGQGGISLSANQVAYANGSGLIVGSANLTFDGTTLTATTITQPPIGSVVAWLKTYTNTPQTLPAGWHECDGSVLSDAASVYNGQTLPNLNGSNYFLRGNSTSGGTGGEDTHTLTTAEMPAHTHTGPAHTHTVVSGGTGIGSQIGAYGPITLTGTINTGSSGTDATGSAGGGTAHENKPPYYNVVWIMRIK